MTHDCYSTKRSTVWAQEKDGKPGYAVKYQDGYISWCPEATFNRDYRAVEGGHLTFGQAIEALKLGKRVRRLGWNGKGMWLKFVPAGVSELSCEERFVALPWIGMKTAGDEFVPWLASQTDVLSEDWEEVRCP